MLRADEYDAKKAAMQMVRFFEFKLSLFGLDKLVKVRLPRAVCFVLYDLRLWGEIYLIPLTCLYIFFVITPKRKSRKKI